MKLKKNQAKEKPQKTIRPNPFNGADDVYLTKNKIAVTRIESKRTERGFQQTKKVKYYARNPGNMKQLKASQGDVVRVGRTGNKYTNI